MKIAKSACLLFVNFHEKYNHCTLMSAAEQNFAFAYAVRPQTLKKLANHTVVFPQVFWAVRLGFFWVCPDFRLDSPETMC